MAVLPGTEAEFEGLPVLSLREAVARGLEYSPQLRASQEVVNQVRTNIKRAYALLLPFVTASGTYTLADKEIKLDFGDSFGDLFRLVAMNCSGWNTGTMGPLPTLCQNGSGTGSSNGQSSGPTVIQQRHNYDFGVSAGVSLLNLRTWPQLYNVYTGVELARLQHDFSRDLLAYAVTQTYFGVAAAQEAVRLTRENLGNAMRHMDLTEIRFTNGVALQNERVRSAMAVLQARNNLDQALAALDGTRTALALLVGREDSAFQVEEQPNLPWETPASSPVRLEDHAGRKDLLMLDKMLVMANRQVTDVWAQFAPTITGVWNWSYSSVTGFGGEHTQWRAIVSLNWSLFSGGMRLADLDESKARVREIRFNRDQAALQARMEVAAALTEEVKARRNLKAGEELVELAKENLALVERQYELGVASQATVVDAETMFNTSRIQVLQGRLVLVLAQMALSRAQGTFDYRMFTHP
jgi:outer membrane protein TolC